VLPEGTQNGTKPAQTRRGRCFSVKKLSQEVRNESGSRTCRGGKKGEEGGSTTAKKGSGTVCLGKHRDRGAKESTHKGGGSVDRFPRAYQRSRTSQLPRKGKINGERASTETGWREKRIWAECVLWRREKDSIFSSKTGLAGYNKQ